MSHTFNNLNPEYEDDDDYSDQDSDEDDCDEKDIEERTFDDEVDTNNTLIYNQCINNMAETYYYSVTDDQRRVNEYGLRISSAFNSWIIDPLPETLAAWYDRNPYQFWNAAKNEPNIKEFAEFVLRLLPTVASEATVERKLWRQRVVTPSDSFSLSEETQINRVLVADEINS